ncbi:Y-family DNA polymerase [Acidisoma sp. 7E03]
MRGRRYLALHFPQLAADRVRRQEPALAGRPLATWAMQGNRRLLTSVDAPGTALRAGQALADAQAIHPDLVLRDADPDGDAAFLEQLALWALRFTPIAAVDAPDGLILDVTGCSHLFGGEAALLDRISLNLRQSGLTLAGVIADGAEAAASLSRAGMDGLTVSPGGDVAAVSPLPLAALRLPADCLVALNRLGLHRVGDLLRQPRAPLARRFGRSLMDVLDALTGARPRLLASIRQPPEFVETVEFLEPIVTRLAIDVAVDALLDPLCRQLADAGQGARQVTLRAFRVDRVVQEITVGTGLPTRTPAHLRRLFANELERLEPDLGFERMSLEAGSTNDMIADQRGLAEDGLDSAGRAEALAQLIDRLAQRLPVWRPAPVESHWPERGVTWASPFDAVPDLPARSPLPAPVRLLHRPVPMMVLAEIPAGPPLRLRLNGAVHDVAHAEGPERIEPEWWKDPERRSGRDYYRVELASGTRLWIGRIAALRPDRPLRWFLHGYLP